MSPEKQRVSIAKACGWTDTQIADGKYGQTDVPDYLNDLNACHEMEEWLKKDDCHGFACYASELFSKHGSDAVHLTAAQRSEAFLRTLGLWEDEANTTKSVSSKSTTN